MKIRSGDEDHTHDTAGFEGQRGGPVLKHVTASTLVDDLVRDGSVQHEDCLVDGDLDLRGVRIKELLLSRVVLRGRLLVSGGSIEVLTLRECQLQAIEMSDIEIKEAAVFSGSNIGGSVVFRTCAFGGGAEFDEVVFHSPVLLEGCSTPDPVVFDGARFERGLSLPDLEIDGAGVVTFAHSHLAGWVWVDDRHWQVASWWKRAWWSIIRQEQSMPRFLVDEANVESCTNPLFKRWVQSCNYARAFQQAHPIAYRFWLIGTDCGRSMSLWFMWVAAIVCLFGLYFSGVTVPAYCPDFLADLLVSLKPELDWGEAAGAFSPYYFSVVTFTTLGFGDIHPANVPAQVAVVIEVFLGYIMLGALIAIFGRRVLQVA